MKIQDTNIYLGSAQILKVYEGDTLIYDKSTPEVFTGLVLTSSGNTTVKFSNASLGLQYKINNGQWINYDDASVNISLSNNDTLKFKRNTDTVLNTSAGKFTIIGNVTASGNIMSLLSNNYENLTNLNNYGPVFKNLFNGCSALTSAANLSLPATTLSTSCYENMFASCTNLLTPPALPATDIRDNCYASMFYRCTSMTTAPVLPATTMWYKSYSHMFEYCTSLTSAPALPATTWDCCYEYMFAYCDGLTSAPALNATVADDFCYRSMFYHCTNLVNAPALPATTIRVGCYNSMFAGCTLLANAPALPATTIAGSCYASMFNNCTSLTSAPVLPATTLYDGCYNTMFGGCTSLTSAPALPATTLALSCYSGMFAQCTGIVEAPDLPASTLVQSCYYRMFDGCSNLKKIKCLATEGFDSSECLYYWTNNVNATGDFIKDPDANEWTTGISGIPTGWTVIDYTSPLTFTANQLSTVSFNNSAPQLQYKINDGEWIDYNTASVSITLQQGDVMKWKRKVSTVMTTKLGKFNITGSATVSGNIMSLLDGENYYTMSDLTGWGGDTESTGIFAGLLSNLPITDASDLLLPATTLAPYCYYNLLAACQSLVYPPELPATVLANGCYSGMFWNCSSMVSTPVLNAPTLVTECYKNMFSKCTNVNYIKCMAINGIGSSNSTTYWTNQVSATGTFVKALDVSTWTTGTGGIPTGWTVINTDNNELCFTADDDSSIMMSQTGSPSITCNIQTSTDKNTWSDYTFGTVIDLSAGDKIYWRGDNYISESENPTVFKSFKILGSVRASGNIMSLINYQNLNNFAFLYLFTNCTGLTVAPDLPATTLAPNCYQNMFNRCTGLTVAPEIPATTIPIYAYQGIFINCSNIQYIKCLATDISATNATNAWVRNVSATGTFIKDPSMSSWTTGESGIPTGWTVIDYTSPLTFTANATSNISLSKDDQLLQYKINDGQWIDYAITNQEITLNTNDVIQWRRASSVATTTDLGSFSITGNITASGNIMSLLDGYNYYTMTNLTGWGGSDGAFYSLFHNCTGLTSLTNFSLPATTLSVNCYKSMFDGCSALTNAPTLPSTTLANNCYESMFNGCSALTSAPALPATTLTFYCYKSMFAGCTSLTTAPDLPAETLTLYCYNNMFNGCTSLNSIKCLATNIWGGSSTTLWLKNVSPTGTFTYASGTYWSPGISGIPTNWQSIELFGGLTLTANADSTFNLMSFEYSGLTYSLNNGDWTPYYSETEIQIPAGQTLKLVRDNDSPFEMGMGMLMMSGNISMSGNINSLLSPNYTTLTDISNYSGCFQMLFYGCSAITSIDGLKLPATTLSDMCYSSMFSNCTGLTSLGNFSLPAEIMTLNCYSSMFSGCTGLTSLDGFSMSATTMAQDCCNGMFSGCSGLTSLGNFSLPAMTLAPNCYLFMFSGCSGLTSLDNFSLPATALATECYSYMFNQCSNLTTLGNFSLPATTMVDSCYGNMFYYCTALTQTPILPATTLAPDCYNAMFMGCSALTTAPALPATTMVDGCYFYMFCRTGLTTAPALPATTLAPDCYNSMFSNCTSLTTAPDLPATILKNYCYSNMFQGCTSLNSIKCLATTFATNSTIYWVSNVSATGTFTKASSATWSTGTSGIPSGWTVVNNSSGD